MAGTNRIDIVLFHRNNILDNILRHWNTSYHRTEFMTVCPLKDNALSI